MRCSISRSALAAIYDHTDQQAPREACGLLLGARDVIDKAVATVNVAADPLLRFEIEPAALFAALRGERAGGARLVGYYHSHPSGDAAPSRADADAAFPDGQLWLIVAGGEVRLWRAVGDGEVHGRFDPVELLACA